MCRISGIVHLNTPPQYEKINAMCDSMKHGGPDDSGIYLDDTYHVALGHRRLSLLDLTSAGHQPMQSPNKNLSIVFNGEIYNYIEIKNILISLGHQFVSNTDTEVILASYEQWGTGCFEKFNGMFALALFDKVSGKLILARDHAGIKPLYYSINKEAIYFSSEVRAFKSLNINWKQSADWKIYFLLFGYIPEPFTTLDNVFSLEKGTYKEIDLKTFKVVDTKYFQFTYHYTIFSEQEAIEKIRTAMEKAVKQHLISDAPIGLFLSGGIDSSILTLLANKYAGNQLQTLSIDFEETTYSEHKYQQLIIDATKANHRTFKVSKQDFLNAIPDILSAIDQPSNDGINSYFITKYAKESGLKAVLSGIGADELFGGYPSFNRVNKLKIAKYIPNYLLQAAVLFPDDKRKKIQFLADQTFPGNYLFNRGFFTPDAVSLYLDIPLNKVTQVINSLSVPKNIYSLHPLEQVSYEETNWYMTNQLLKDTDYMSMWNSVEVRVPFLDKELMQLIYTIHPDIRYSNKQIKHLLIKSFMDVLPEAIWNRPKQGFVFPFQHWFADSNLPAVNDLHANKLKSGLKSGKTHWSRYWCYNLITQIPNSHSAW